MIGRAAPAAHKLGWPEIATCALAAAIIAPAAAAGAGNQRAVLIRDALLIDGSGHQPRPATDILIRKGRIVRVGATGSIEVGGGVSIVEATGKTVIPGIINLRGLAGLVRGPGMEGEDFGRLEIVRHLARYASYGRDHGRDPGPQAPAPQERP